MKHDTPATSAAARKPAEHQRRPIRRNPLAPSNKRSQAVTPAPGQSPFSMTELHAELLLRLEQGTIRPEEMTHFQLQSNDATVDQELTRMLLSIQQLERHRLRLIEHLRALRSGT